MKKELKNYLFQGEFGLEKESLRVDSNGFLAQTKHPFSDIEHFDRDFCENQVELITDVCGSIHEVWNQLASLHKEAVETLLQLDSGPEYLWPFSNPPYVRGEEDIPIADFSGELRKRTVYREYLMEKYGKKKMLYSGIHFNFSFPDEFIHAGFKNSGMEYFQQYKDALYLELGRKSLRYNWLVVYLFSASPILDASFIDEARRNTDVVSRYASVRCGEEGYWNYFTPVLDYSAREAYAGSIRRLIETGQIREAAELYYPIRLKSTGKNSIENLEKTGINHIEYRMLDLNPFSAVGIDRRDIAFLYLLTIYMLYLDEEPFGEEAQLMAVRNVKEAALLDETEIKIVSADYGYTDVRKAALTVLDDMDRVFASLESGLEMDVKYCIEYQRRKITVPSARYADRVKDEFQNGYVKKGLRLAKQYAQEEKIG